MKTAILGLVLALVASSVVVGAPTDVGALKDAAKKILRQALPLGDVVRDLNLKRELNDRDSRNASTAIRFCTDTNHLIIATRFHLETLVSEPGISPRHFNHWCDSVVRMIEGDIDVLTRVLALTESPALIAEVRDVLNLAIKVRDLIKNAKR